MGLGRGVGWLVGSVVGIGVTVVGDGDGCALIVGTGLGKGVGCVVGSAVG